MIKNYRRRKDKKGRICILSYETNDCPVCMHNLYVIGTRERKCIKGGEIIEILVIRRLRCKGCRVIHHELPDILTPYKRHCGETVEKVIGGDVADVCCEKRTIQRIKAWWEGCRSYFEGALTSLIEKHGPIFSEKPAPREIIRAVVNANLWVHTRSAFLSG